MISRNQMKYAWLVVMLLFPVALLNYLDRQMISAMKGSMMHDIPDIGSDANWGFMLGQFKWVYAFLSPLGGYIADRYSKRFTICASLFVWSTITWITGRVHSYEELLWTRTLMGVSEAFYIPAALALIADYHCNLTRSKAVGFHQIAIYCGVLLGGFSGYIADEPKLTWRFAFDITGIVGICYALPLMFVLKDAPVDFANQNTQQKLSVIQAGLALMTNFSFLLLVVYFTLPAIAGWVVRDWMPAILQKTFNISQGVAGVSATLYWQVAAIFAALFGGWLADRWMLKTSRGRIYVSALGMVFIIPALFGVGNAASLNSLPLALISLVLFGIGWGFFDCNNMPILSQIVGPNLRATGYGIMNLVSISCGGFADWGFGLLQDRHVSLNMIFSLFASLALFSMMLVLLIQPREDKDLVIVKEKS
jgi:MFS family permease